ncbi:MAG TPA: VOC family protein [Caulobacteraceae bacterium]|nr:VOC family protein [Caulobacteraceae bacterium]
MDVPPISPLIFYRDARAALDFLERAFGFETRMVVDDGQGGVIHSESVFEGHVVMVSGPPPAPKYASPLDLGGRRTGSIHVQLKDGIDALCERARAAGATIEREPADQPYGDRVFTCFDPEGHAWSFGQEVEALSAEEMAAATGRKIATSLDAH